MRFLIQLFLLLIPFSSFAQNDSSAYEAQRKKINSLLQERSAKFGKYDESLAQRTGIFGLKTKKDMQRSIDILTGIVQTDNEIFKELKVLLDYKDLEKNQVQGEASESKERLSGYMQTIKKLQQENDRLKDELVKIEKQHSKFLNTLIALVIVLVISGIMLLVRKK